MRGRKLKALLMAAALIALAPPAGMLHAATITPCASTETTASIGSSKVAQPKGGGLGSFTIVLAGDTGFNRSDAAVEAEGVRNKGGETLGFSEMTSGIAPDIDGDLAFANIETVITDRSDIGADDKGQGSFHFKSHPLGLKALIDVGFNLFALANNHAMDYGAAGVEETLFHMASAAALRAIAYAGIGANFEEATRASCLELDGTRIGFAAIGIITGDRPEHRAGKNRPGQASYRHRPDFEVVVDRLARLAADYRILSIHYGLEGRVVPDARQLEEWRGLAAGAKGIDLIVGHHPHVAQGVELSGTSLIFYGLGNFLHPGTAEMTRFGICRDYGLMAKVHLAKGQNGAFTIAAVEAIPLTKTNLRPERFASPQESQTRIQALNYLDARLGDGKGARGLSFTPQADGSGLYCAEGAADLGGKVGALCKGWEPPADPPRALLAKIAKSCEDKPFYGAGKREPSLWDLF